MKVPFVDLQKQYLTLKVKINDAINQVMNNSQFINGSWVNNFEIAFSEKNNIKYCIGVGNGTDALIISLKQLGIGKGDEVILPANSFIATSESISITGAKPVFVDVDEYYNIDINKIPEKITKATKAIIAVHLYGQPAQIEKIAEISKTNNLFLIEDCAQAHFASYNNKYCGTFGDIATFSFYPSKNLGCYGDGGCIITNNEILAKKIRIYSNHGSTEKHNHIIEGINSRLDGIQAAILLQKLSYIDNWNIQRFEAAQYYSELLINNEFITIPKIIEGASHIFHLYVIKAYKRDELKKYLKNKEIETGLHYKYALPFLECYKSCNYSSIDFPVAYSNQNEILSLPIFPEIEKQQIEYVVESINEFYTQ